MTIAIICLVIAAIMPYLVIIPAKINDAYDNKMPRASDSYKSGLSGRAYAAHQNCLEAFPIFAAALFAILFIRPDNQVIEWAPIIYIILRLCFVIAYYLDQSKLRSTFWIGAFSINLYMFVIALI